MTTNIPSAAGNPEPGSETPPPQEILDFLDTAPPELREWAEATARRVQDEHDAAQPTPDAEPVDEPAAAEAGATVITPADLRTHPEPFKRERKGWHPSTAILATLAVAALVFGIYWIGQPQSPDAVQAGAPQEQAADPQVDMARLAELEQLLAEDPANIDAHLEMGVLLVQLGDYQRAEHHWLRVTMEDPENEMAWFNLGFLYLSQPEPDMEKAEAAWRTLLEVAPDSKSAEVVRGHMGSMLGLDDVDESAAAQDN